MSQRRRLSWAEVRAAVFDCGVLSLACLLAYWLVTFVFSRVYSLSRADDLVGSLWAVIATVFVFRDSYLRSVRAAASRMSATLVSFVICLIYLTFLPFYPWALAVLIGVSALTVTLMGQPDGAITAGITTAVVMVTAALTPHDAWQQPILRFVDTIIGIAVGIAAAWVGLRMLRPESRLRNPLPTRKAGALRARCAQPGTPSARSQPLAATQRIPVGGSGEPQQGDERPRALQQQEPHWAPAAAFAARIADPARLSSR
jgi:uncharacterized membrane protein YccC